ncbi:hypothetical protein CIHG_05923 [Coccidioides immitis H538.4]|uniref:Uncharacterized protein n=1 Tax=Coccidioides immitis H538.4 TaxID=396776 RepID=A0A0J8RQY3_COCIT|nr:hypothetical protein CIHG_05923 [Coccidioides immitis H538.4]
MASAAPRRPPFVRNGGFTADHSRSQSFAEGTGPTRSRLRRTVSIRGVNAHLDSSESVPSEHSSLHYGFLTSLDGCDDDEAPHEDQKREKEDSFGRWQPGVAGGKRRGVYRSVTHSGWRPHVLDPISEHPSFSTLQSSASPLSRELLLSTGVSFRSRLSFVDYRPPMEAFLNSPGSVSVFLPFNLWSPYTLPQFGVLHRQGFRRLERRRPFGIVFRPRPLQGPEMMLRWTIVRAASLDCRDSLLYLRLPRRAYRGCQREQLRVRDDGTLVRSRFWPFAKAGNGGERETLTDSPVFSRTITCWMHLRETKDNGSVNQGRRQGSLCCNNAAATPPQTTPGASASKPSSGSGSLAPRRVHFVDGTGPVDTTSVPLPSYIRHPPLVAPAPRVETSPPSTSFGMACTVTATAGNSREESTLPFQSVSGSAIPDPVGFSAAPPVANSHKSWEYLSFVTLAAECCRLWFIHHLNEGTSLSLGQEADDRVERQSCLNFREFWRRGKKASQPWIPAWGYRPASSR